MEDHRRARPHADAPGSEPSSDDAPPSAARPHVATPEPRSSPEQAALSGPDEAAFSGAGVEDALHNEERGRARVFFRAFQVMAVTTGAFIPVLPGPVWLRALAGVGIVAGFVTCTLALRLLRRGAYTEKLIAAVGVSCALVGVTVIYYVGIFSAASMALALGVYFFAASQSRLVARLVYSTVAVLYFVLSVITAADLVPDTALFPTTGAAPLSRWFQVFMSQVLFGVTFYLARNNRRTLERTIERVIAAGRQIRQRDAQLAEAHRELDRALRPGDGRRSGETVGPYVLGPLLGRGGMGEVYRGEHTTSSERVAVKVLHAHLLESDQHRKLFLREVEISASLVSPHAVRVLGSGETADGAPFLVMEMLEGHDLGWILRKNGKLELRVVVELVDQIKNALVAMRDMDLVHRDVKPGNLFRTSGSPPTWKILDFGLAKALGTSTSMTQDQMLGTPAYMAPEQLRGQVGHTSDLYGVAAIVYRALTGATPFDGDDLARVVLRVAYEQPPDPRRFVRLPSDVELVLALGLAKAQADRFPTIEAFADALRAASTGELDDLTRRRGWQLLRRAPWGSTRLRDADEPGRDGAALA